MSKHIINAGATSQRFYIYLQDSTTGQGETGVVAATCYYLRDSVSGSMPAAVTLTFGAVFASPGTYPAWSSGAVREIGYMPGLYLIDIPDAVFAAGARNAVVQIFPTSGTPWLPVNLEFTLSAVNVYDSVRMGMTALPNFNAGVLGGLPLSINTAGAVNTVQINGTTQTARDIGASVLLSSGTGTGQISLSSGLVTLAGVTHTNAVIPTVTTVTNNVGVGSIANNVITKITDGTLTAAKFGDSALVIGNAAAGGVKAYLAASAVNSTVLANDAITSTKIANDAITAGKIATGAIDADAIAADAITNAKIADSAITIRLSTDATASEGRLFAGAVAGDVWNALLASYTTANTFGARIVRTRDTSPQNEVTITGSYHLAADVHEIQPATITAADFAANAIDANALATSAVTEIANGVMNTDPSTYASSTSGYWLYQAGLNSQGIISDTNLMTASPYIESIADSLLNRNVGGGSNSGRLVKEALYALRNKSVITGSTLSVYDAVDVLSWTAAVTSSTTADPVTGIDP
jgi:hypothetical protein